MLIFPIYSKSIHLPSILINVIFVDNTYSKMTEKVNTSASGNTE